MESVQSKSWREQTDPRGLEPEVRRRRFLVHERVTRPLRREEPGLFPGQRTMATVDVVDGFEDILQEPLGAGFWLNTPTSTYQLASVVALSKNPRLDQILEARDRTSGEIVAALRDQRVLSGLKVLDIGCGDGSLAAAIQALGAKAYTADAEQLNPDRRSQITGHVAIDLNSTEALSLIRQVTGGHFDIVTENIIEPLLSQKRLQRPKDTRILELGHGLLKRGGYLHYSGSNSEQKMLRKR